MVEFQNVSKVYNKNVVALSDINLSISSGEFVFIVGASGAGKSTFLKLMLCEERPTSGRIIIDGKDLSTLRKKDIPYLRRAMGVVFQDFRVVEKMTVYDNVAFAMHITGASEREIRKRVPYVLGLVGLENKASRIPSELSGGEKQRIGLARALVNNPHTIIADEPTGNIDPSMSYEIVELLGEINKRGTTIIMVTHDLSMIEKFNFRIVEIFNGKIKNDTSLRNENNEI